MHPSEISYWGEGEPGRLPGTEAEYERLVRQLVTTNAPRVFAIVQDWGVHYDSRIAAWGLAWEEADLIIDTDPRPVRPMTLTSRAMALQRYTRAPHVTARICWVDPEVH